MLIEKTFITRKYTYMYFDISILKQVYKQKLVTGFPLTQTSSKP